MCQLVLPGMREQRAGRIVNISSMGGEFTFPGGGVYHATKYAVEALSDALRFEVAGFGVQVVVVQPGLIRTAFAATAAAEVDPGDGPYAEFNAAVATTTKQAYEQGGLARLGAGPDAVAKTIETAICTAKPRTRYRVTPVAHLLITLRRLMSDRVWDRFVATAVHRADRLKERQGTSATAASGVATRNVKLSTRYRSTASASWRS